MAGVLGSVLLLTGVYGQRTYVQQSVLSTGEWHQLAVGSPGLQRIDAAVFSRLGIPLPVPTSSIRLFGNGGGMLPEANLSDRTDDLRENAIFIEDGGDGSFSGSDYVLFYSEGADRWEPDPAGRSYRFQRNLYSPEAYYYLNIAPGGRRVGVQAAVGSASFTVDRYDERFVHEPDSLNFLSSGKGWYGDEFGTGPGRLLTREYLVPSGIPVAGTSVTVRTDVIARSNGQPAHNPTPSDATISRTPGVKPAIVGCSGACGPTQISQAPKIQSAASSTRLLRIASSPGAVRGVRAGTARRASSVAMPGRSAARSTSASSAA